MYKDQIHNFIIIEIKYYVGSNDIMIVEFRVLDVEFLNYIYISPILEAGVFPPLADKKKRKKSPIISIRTGILKL